MWRRRILAAALAGAIVVVVPVQARAQDDLRIVNVNFLERDDIDSVLLGVFNITRFTFDENTRTLAFRAGEESTADVMRAVRASM